MIRIGDKVIYRESYREQEYSWKLINNDEYIVTNRAFDKMGIDSFIEVRHRNGTETTWYYEDDFITLKEFRKEKLKKINAIRAKEEI
jgi:hypothetical protein